MGIQQKRREKELRRKRQLAERSRAAIAQAGSARARRVRRYAAAPISECLIQEGLLQRGNGTIMLLRRPAVGTLAMAAFLVDTYCLGVKDAMFQVAPEEEISSLIDAMGATGRLEPADPSYARKLLHDVVDWARTLGLQPHADYTEAEMLFGDVDAQSCSIAFEFGLEGRPCYVPGPTDTAAQTRRRVEILTRRLGADGFDFVAAADPGARIGEYDADHAPDAAEWLELDEAERLFQVEDYHRSIGEEDLEMLSRHATAHVIVEDQIAAEPTSAAGRALSRLIVEGLDRHEAIHAVACVYMAAVSDAVKAGATAETLEVPPPCDAELDRLTVETWRRDYGDGSEDEA
jgi:hypothetical protein